MPKTQQTPATDQATGAGEATRNALHPSPYHLALVPTDRTEWWHYELHVNGRPAIRFNVGAHAIDTLAYAVEDRDAGISIGTRQNLDDLAGGAMRPRDYINGTRYEVCEGWG